MKAATHPSQANRLALLHSYQILDTPAEAEFDDIVAIAAGICGTEASTITFIDADRQWFKAATGMAGETAPLELAVCAHTILESGFLEIEDTLLDARTKHNPGCHGPEGFRFYAGAQLMAVEGLPLGTLCVLGKRPQKLTHIQRQTLQVLAHHVVKLLDLRLALENADILRKEVDHRVCNSLQLVASLTALQKRKSPDQNVKDALSQVQERVMALATLHQTMQNSDAQKTVNLRVLVNDLARLIRQSVSGDIALSVDIDDLFVTSSIASAVAVVVNEFASNSLKHGFDEGETGTIRFVGRANPDGRFSLVCSDDGKCATASAGSGGLGQLAMRAIANRLNGNITIDTVATGYQMTFVCPIAGN